MEIKLFGRSLFKASKSEQLYGLGTNAVKESKFLIDFHRDLGGSTFSEGYYNIITDIGGVQSDSVSKYKQDNKKKTEKAEPKNKLTPKGVFELQMLNDKSFKLKTDPEYVDGQLKSFKEKLSLIKSEEYDMGRGVKEIASIVSRMENRKKYASVKDFYEEFPYTTTLKIDELVKTHNYLKLGQVAQFLADMPKEAVDIMKSYNKNTEKLCGKQAVFYIIADKKDFEKSEKRRDPILLAQSPFGHFWQILGAWDKELLILSEI